MKTTTPAKSRKSGSASRVPTRRHDDYVIAKLKNSPTFAAEYLRVAFEESGDDPAALLIALRRMAEARGGLTAVAKSAGVGRESLYKALSGRGNPRFTTLLAVTKAVGFRLSVEAAA